MLWCQYVLFSLDLHLLLVLDQFCLHYLEKFYHKGSNLWPVLLYFLPSKWYKSILPEKVTEIICLLKYGFHKKYFRKNEPLTSWTLFSPVFSRSVLIQCWSGKKRGKKVFNWSEVHFFGSTSYEIHILVTEFLCDRIRETMTRTAHIKVWIS